MVVLRENVMQTPRSMRLARVRRAGSKDLHDKLHFVPKLLAAVAVRGRAIVFLGDDMDFKAEPASTHSPGGWIQRQVHAGAQAQERAPHLMKLGTKSGASCPSAVSSLCRNSMKRCRIWSPSTSADPSMTDLSLGVYNLTAVE